MSIKDFDDSIKIFNEGDFVAFNKEYVNCGAVHNFLKNEAPSYVNKDSIFRIAEVVEEESIYLSKKEFGYKISFNGEILGPEEDNIWSGAYFQKHDIVNVSLKIGDICPKCNKEYKERQLATSTYIGCWC